MNFSRTRHLRLTAIGIVALAAGSLVACSPEPEPTPTPTAAFASEEEAFAAAEEVYRAYNDALNSVDTHDTSTFEPLFALAEGDFEANDRESLSELHAEGFTLVGETLIASFDGISADADFGRVTALVCIDVSNSDVLDATGQSQVSTERADMNAVQLTFALVKDRLLISHAERDEEAMCPSEQPSS